MAITKILFVDDEPVFREVIEEYLQFETDVDLDLAENYATAIEQIRKNRYDVIILDGLEGDCFKIHEEVREIPHGEVVIFSGNTRIRKEAESRGIPFYDKGQADENLNKILAQYKLSA